MTFCWQKLAGYVHAWCSVNGTFLADEVSQVHWLFSKVACEPLGRFRFKDAGPRDTPSGLCGTAALLDLQAFLMRHALCNVSEVVKVAASLHRRLLRKFQVPGQVRMPCIVAGVVGAMLKQEDQRCSSWCRPFARQRCDSKGWPGSGLSRGVSSRPSAPIWSLLSRLSCPMSCRPKSEAAFRQVRKWDRRSVDEKLGRKETRGAKAPGAPIAGPPMLPASETLAIPD